MVLLALIILTGCSEGGYPYSPGENLSVVFFDVGQGSSTLLLIPDGRKVLIDCGEFDDAAEYLRMMNITWIDVLIITHAHSDHDGGCEAVKEVAEIGEILKNTNVDKDFVLKISDYAYLEVIVAYDSNGRFKGDNDNSVVLKVGYGNSSFLFTGDCEFRCEEELIKTQDIEADVLNAGHHGSKHSSIPDFLDEVGASLVVISAGKGNQYGHPNNETLERYAKIGADVHRTDLEGVIIVSTDGRNYFVS